MKKCPSSVSGLRGLSICIVTLLVSSVLAAAQHGTLIHAFGVVPGDGSSPRGGLIADAAGNVYGATEIGGANNQGAVYELSPPGWRETVLYSFTGGADGAGPYGNLVLDGQGNLYGITNGGGNPSCAGGCGTVFELSPPTMQGGSWTETTIYSFAGGNDGAFPLAGLALDQAGSLFGTTQQGGGSACDGTGCGTVFELSPPIAPQGSWTETVLYSFTGGTDGGFPVAPLVLDGLGDLFGTTSAGGIPNSCEFLGCGTVFGLTPSGGGGWTESVIHDFGSINNDGLGPQSGLLLTKSGALAGTTAGGGTYGAGTVFGMQPPSQPGGMWSYSILYSFGGIANDGSVPQSGVISNGGNSLFGTTVEGGSMSDGVVFRLTWNGSAWKETGLLTNQKPKVAGGHPIGGLLLNRGALYGTANAGGPGGGGTVFKITQ